MEQIVINDEKMYSYFDTLLYGEDQKLKKEWKQDSILEEYGLTGHDVYKILGSKTLLYGRKDAERQICLLDAMQKFIHDYIGIEGLGEMLINNYGAIENSIFFEHDSSGKPVHIREHAKHQMKNAYLGSVLLLDCGYLKQMAADIYQAQSQTTRYMVAQAEMVLQNNVLDIFRKSDKEERMELEKKQREDIQEKLEEWVYKIFMVSSMLHDIGYPLEYYLRSAQMLTDYPPYLNILSPVIKAEFSQIKACLIGSQLFGQVDNDEIKKKYQVNNHGVLSAISLLMHFYSGGLIYSLSPDQRCIIEMSALAIYHHTDKFRDGFRMVYMHDPISYIVRLCDDLQEWQRFKLIISDKHNYLQCVNCGKILLEDKKMYHCSCDRYYTKITQIENRKVNYICLCDEMILQPEEECITIIPQFNLMKQIEILLDDYTAVVKNDNDLKSVGKLVENQALMPSVKITFFLSNNPVMIITEMIEKSGKSDKEIRNLIDSLAGEKKANLLTFYEDYLAKKVNNPFGNKLETNKPKYEKEVKEFVKMYYGEIYTLYSMINA